MGDLTTQSDRLIEEGRVLRDDNRAGGRHRRTGSIGKGSAARKAEHFARTLVKIAVGVVAVLIAAGIVGGIVGGLGFWGVMATILALLVVVGVLAIQKVKTPKRADINKGSVQDMVSKTELWLEAQRPALPAPAARLVDDMGVQLDTLGMQLETVDANHPKAREVRSLVGEQLPEMVDAYRRIPAHLRTEKRGGRTPDEQLTESLGKISSEIDSITRQLAEGSLDDLAIKHRFLDYKFGEGTATAPELEGKN